MTANSGVSVYGQSPTNPGLTVIGLQNGDALTGLSNSFGITNFTNAATTTLNVNGTFSNQNYVVSRRAGIWIARSGTAHGGGELAVAVVERGRSAADVPDHLGPAVQRRWILW